MRVIIAAIGRMKNGPERELAARYEDRFSKAGKSLGFSALQILESAESRATSAEQRKSEEAEQLLSAVPADSFVVALDERGKSQESEAFAHLIARHRDEGRGTFVVLIGGADGLDAKVRKRADLIISFGAMTWPHQIVRILAAEQLYRAVTILSGHPYHRA